jgi:hypothetical protein
MIKQFSIKAVNSSQRIYISQDKDVLNLNILEYKGMRSVNNRSVSVSRKELLDVLIALTEK